MSDTSKLHPAWFQHEIGKPISDTQLIDSLDRFFTEVTAIGDLILSLNAAETSISEETTTGVGWMLIDKAEEGRALVNRLTREPVPASELGGRDHRESNPEETKGGNVSGNSGGEAEDTPPSENDSENEGDLSKRASKIQAQIFGVMEILDVLEAMNGCGDDMEIMGKMVHADDFRETFIQRAIKHVHKASCDLDDFNKAISKS